MQHFQENQAPLPPWLPAGLTFWFLVFRLCWVLLNRLGKSLFLQLVRGEVVYAGSALTRLLLLGSWCKCVLDGLVVDLLGQVLPKQLSWWCGGGRTQPSEFRVNVGPDGALTKTVSRSVLHRRARASCCSADAPVPSRVLTSTVMPDANSFRISCLFISCALALELMFPQMAESTLGTFRGTQFPGSLYFSMVSESTWSWNWCRQEINTYCQCRVQRYP